MSERVMPKMFDFQKELVEDTTSKFVIGNYSRGLGKNFTIACKILYERPRNVLLIDSNPKAFKVLEEKFKEIFHLFYEVNEDIKYFSCKYDKLKIEFNNGDIVNIYNEKIRGINVNVWDMVIYNDCLPLGNISTKKNVSMVTIPCKFLKWKYPYDNVRVYSAGLKQMLESNLGNKEWIIKTKNTSDSIFKNEIDILNEYDELFPNDKNNFYDKQIKELMIEFEQLPKTQNTTITREKILGMIEMLQKMKLNNK